MTDTYKRRYRSFHDASKYVHSLRLGSREDWKRYVKSGNKPDDIPAHQKLFTKMMDGRESETGWVRAGMLPQP